MFCAQPNGRQVSENTVVSKWLLADSWHARHSKRCERLDFSFCENLNTAHTSLSKQDIVRAYQKVLDNEVDGVLRG